MAPGTAASAAGNGAGGGIGSAVAAIGRAGVGVAGCAGAGTCDGTVVDAPQAGGTGAGAGAGARATASPRCIGGPISRHISSTLASTRSVATNVFPVYW